MGSFPPKPPSGKLGSTPPKPSGRTSSSPPKPPPDRRRYRRLRVPLYCRPAGVHFLARQREPVDISLGGVRIFSDEPMRVGELLKMEFFLPDVAPVTYTGEVVWIEELTGESAPARYDVGLKFIQLEPDALKLLLQVLGPPED
ncbi:MAG TPA: PilZ domain-containing protein [Polyangiaceae bacterium]|nr:PilZ domain-containing protein [Polyangiaceae bacterium]